VDSWRQLTAGLRYARQDRVVGLLILSTAVMTVCAFPYMTLLPAIVSKSLGFSGKGLSRVVAFVMAANGLGALAGALAVAGLPATLRRDRVIPFTLAALAVLLIGFSLSRWLPLTLALSTLAGAALLASSSLTNTSIQVAVPGHLRGRVMALFVLAFMGMMPISSILFGSLGQKIGPAGAVLVGAVVLLAWAAVLVARPGLLRAGEGAAAASA
jgi:predicted MFS family arabinose efflux permease